MPRRQKLLHGTPGSSIQKGAYALLSLLRMALMLALATGFILTAVTILNSILEGKLTIDVALMWKVVKSPWYVIPVSLIVLHVIRRILFRLQDKDIFKV